MKLSVKDFFSKYEQIRSFKRIRSHLLKKSLTENFIFCALENFSIEDFLNKHFVETKVWLRCVNLFVPNAHFFYPLKTSENKWANCN